MHLWVQPQTVSYAHPGTTLRIDFNKRMQTVFYMEAKRMNFWSNMGFIVTALKVYVNSLQLSKLIYSFITFTDP